MTETIFLEKTTEVRRNFRNIQKKLNVKLKLIGRKITVSGDSINEYVAKQVFEAMNFGFSAEKALTLAGEGIAFRKLHIRDFTRRKNLKEVKARLIGSQGRTKKTLENISNTEIIVHDNEVGIIGSVESIESAITAITNIIKGSKQSNVYKYLEKRNVKKEEGLGLR